jgi:hypothetical protein
VVTHPVQGVHAFIMLCTAKLWFLSFVGLFEDVRKTSLLGTYFDMHLSLQEMDIKNV